MCVSEWIYAFVPIEGEATQARTELAMLTAIQFIVLYFHWWPALIATALNLVAHQIGRLVIHDEPIDSLTVAVVLVDVVLNGLFCYFIHLMTSLFGKYYVQSEILRIGNESILDGLEEGVIIKDEFTNEIIYINKSAK